MKLIIEEGDVGLIPGVYDVTCRDALIAVEGSTPGVKATSKLTIYQPPRTTLELELEVDMNQKPKPLPAGGRYDFEFRKHERIDPNDTVFEAMVRDRVDPSKDYMTRRMVSNTMLDTQRLEAEIVVRELTNYIVKHLVQRAIEKVLPTMCKDNTVKAFTNHVKPTEPPPVATCNKTPQDCRRHGNGFNFGGEVRAGDGKVIAPCPFRFGDSACTRAEAKAPPPVAKCNKTWTDCKRHGNTARYRGFVNVNTKKLVPCPYAFGDPLCTGVPRSTAGEVMEAAKLPPAMPDTYLPQPGFAAGGVVGVDPQGQPLVYNGEGLIDYATADVDLVRKLQGVQRKTGSTVVKDCDVCYGTGRFKGFGGPCSEGCPTKEEK